MKAKLISMMIGLILVANTQISAQKRVTVEAVNEDISYYLDLKAVAYIFGESSNLEDFEYKLNDNDNNISNLDLNGDGYIDYLRVIEVSENKVHLVVIQAILDKDVFQDVATIVVGRNSFNRMNIQVVGDPYIYGSNYIIEPYYYRTPSIVSWFWSPYYTRWYSPFYWGHYPRYYSYRRPLQINIYLSHVSNRINNNRNHYRYADNYRYNDYNHLQRSISRNDYSRRNPEKEFNRRNNDYRNKQDLHSSRERISGTNDNHRNTDRISSGSRGNQGYSNSRDNNNSTNRDNSRINSGSRNNPSTRIDNNNSSGNNSNVRNEDNSRSNEVKTNRNSQVNRPETRSNSEYQQSRERNMTRSQSDNNQNRNSKVSERNNSRTESTSSNRNSERKEPTVSRSNNDKVQTPTKSTERVAKPEKTQRQDNSRSNDKKPASNRNSDNNESRR